MAQLKQRNHQACLYLYDTYAPALYTCILQIVKEEELADQVTKDAFLYICREIVHYDASKERLFTWLSKAARKIALQAMQQGNESRQVKDQPGASIDTPKEARVLTDHCGLKAVMHILPKDEATLINLCYFEGLTYGQIAETMQVPAGTARRKVHSALKKLKNVLS